MSNVTEPATSTDPAAPVAEQKPRKTSMALLNLWLDAALFLTLIFVMWITVMLHVVFPAGTTAAGWELWGWSYDQWRAAQFYALCFCAALAVEHVVLHWNWICSIIATKVLRAKSKPDEGSQAIYGVGTFIVVLLVVMSTILAALVSVKQP